MDTLYVNNDHTIELKELRGSDGSFITGATATATLFEADGVTEVVGAAWPLSLGYTGQRGTYRGEIGPNLQVTPGQRYKLRIKAEFSGRTFEITRTVQAERRYE